MPSSLTSSGFVTHLSGRVRLAATALVHPASTTAAPRRGRSPAEIAAALAELAERVLHPAGSLRPAAIVDRLAAGPLGTGGAVDRTPWGRVVLVCAAGVPAAIALGKVGVVGPLMRPDLGLSLPQLGLAVSAITVVAALLGTPAGLWTGGYGPRRTLLAGLAVMTVAAAAGGLAWGLGPLLAARVVEGVGFLLVVVAAPDLLVQLTRGADRAAALALWGTVIPVGLAVGGVAGGALAPATGWRGWLGLTGVLPALAAVAVAMVIPPDPARPDGARPPLRLAGLGRTAPLAGGFCGLCLIGIAMVSLLPTFLVGERGTGLGTAGAATAVVAFASVPGSLAASWLLRRGAGLRPLSVVVLVMPLAAVPAFRAGGALGVAVAAAAALMLANGVAVAAAFAAVPEVVRDPGQITLAIGLMTQLGSTGTLLGAPLFGGVVDAVDWSAFAPLVLLVTLLTLGMLLAASARRSRVPSP
jgi:predicted MFS family arabinose efflux permease